MDGRGALLDVAEVAFDQGAGGAGLEVPGDGEDGVGGRVVGVEERLGVLDGGGFEVAEGAVAVVGVGEGVEHDRRELEPGEPAVGPVEDVDPDLLFDDADLVLEVLGGDGRAPHPVGFEEQGQFQAVGGQEVEVVGVVDVGRAVEGAAGGLDVPHVLGLADVVRALEHHVLEEVREPGSALGLGAHADVVHHCHADHRRSGVGGQDHPQSVVEPERLDRERRCGNRRNSHGQTLSHRSARC